MIKIENVETVGWEAAIRGMRNPLNSWDKNDSMTGFEVEDARTGRLYDIPDVFIGHNDHALMMKLRNAGTDHRKFMRMIICYCDITAPLYWWKQADCYRNGVEKNSCSTMHKIAAKEFTLDDFSTEHLSVVPNRDPAYFGALERTIFQLNEARHCYLESKNKDYWWQLIQILPSSYNQKRTCMISYEALANMYHARKNHKLDEWREFCKFIGKLPYAELITGEMGDVEK